MDGSARPHTARQQKRASLPYTNQKTLRFWPRRQRRVVSHVTYPRKLNFAIFRSSTPTAHMTSAFTWSRAFDDHPTLTPSDPPGFLPARGGLGHAASRHRVVDSLASSGGPWEVWEPEAARWLWVPPEAPAPTAPATSPTLIVRVGKFRAVAVSAPKVGLMFFPILEYRRDFLPLPLLVRPLRPCRNNLTDRPAVDPRGGTPASSCKCGWQHARILPRIAFV